MATTNDHSLTLAQAIAQFLADPTTGTGYTLQTYGVGLKRLLAYVASTGAQADGSTAVRQAHRTGPELVEAGPELIQPQPELVEAGPELVEGLVEGLAEVQAPASLIGVPFALRWISWLLEDQGISERTLLTYLAGFSRFVRFLHNRGLANLSADDVLRLQTELRQVRRVHRPPSRQVRAPSEEDVAALVRAARSAGTRGAERDELRRLRDIAMLELLRSSGMRVGELVALRRRDQEESGRGARLSRLRVMGKGRKERWAYADADAWAAIRAYLQARATLDGNTGKSLGGLPLFARHDKGAGSAIRPLTTRSVQIVIEELARQAGLEEQGISPHSLRHYFATRVLRVTGNLAIVQDLLDHRSPETTRIYAEVDEAQMRTAHEQAFGPSARDLAPAHRGDDSG